MARMYSVSLTGSWNVPVEAENPREAAIKALKKNEPSLKDKNVTVVIDKNAPQLTVTLASKTARKMINKYRVVTDAPINNIVGSTSDAMLQTKMDVIAEFKKKADQAKKSYAESIEKLCKSAPDPQAKLLEWNDEVKANVKTMIKNGATPKECASEFFKKNSLNYEEMIMQAQNFGDGFIDIDVKDKNAVMTALNKYPCMILAKRQGGGVTGYIGTTNLNLHSALYEPNMFVLYALTEVYHSFMDINTRKINALSREYETKEIEKGSRVQLASCSMRMKEIKIYNRNTKVYQPTGVFEVSSASYTCILDNILLMKAFAGSTPVPVDRTVTQYLGAALLNYNEDEFKKKFNFDRVAFKLAMMTVQGGSLPKNEILLMTQNRANSIDIDATSFNAYINKKMPKLEKDVQWHLYQLNKGCTY